MNVLSKSEIVFKIFSRVRESDLGDSLRVLLLKWHVVTAYVLLEKIIRAQKLNQMCQKTQFFQFFKIWP